MAQGRFELPTLGL